MAVPASNHLKVGLVLPQVEDGYAGNMIRIVTSHDGDTHAPEHRFRGVAHVSSYLFSRHLFTLIENQ